MKAKLCSLPGLLLAALLAPAFAQQPAPHDPSIELNALVARIQAKLRAGQTSPAELSKETAEFAALRTKSAAREPETAARVALIEYTFHADVLKDNNTALNLRTDFETRYGEYLAGSPLGRELEMRDRMQAARNAKAGIVGQPAPELNFIWSTREGLTKLSALKGKVVVLDFWATWCGPCIATFPEIRELVTHYHAAEVVVLGVTSLQGYVAGLSPTRIDTKDDPKKEFGLMSEFIQAKRMTWPVVFTDEPVFHPGYGVTGIPHMAIIAPDGTVRHNGLHPGATPHAEKVEMIDKILKEFGKTAAVRSGDE